MKRELLHIILLLSIVFELNAQWLPNGNNIYFNNGNVGIGTNNPIFKLDVSGGDSRFDSNFKLFIPSAGSSYFWMGSDGLDNVKFSVWDKFTFYNPTVAGINTNNSGWNIQLGARDGSIYTRGGAFFALNNGNVGIGTSSPVDKIQIGNFNNEENLKLNIPGTYNFEQIKMGQYGNGACGLEFINHTDITNSYGIRLYSNVDNGFQGLQIQTALPTNSYPGLSYTTRIAVTTNGNIGIGTINPQYKLDVIGNIRAQEIIVNINGADYVFEDEYKLMSLNELENFVNANKRLPDIVSAEEMEKNGTDLGNLNSKLLQKIEEMTLYMIQQNKKIEELSQVVVQQSKEIEKLIISK